MFIISGSVSTSPEKKTVQAMLDKISAREVAPMVYADEGCALGIQQIYKGEAFGDVVFPSAPEYAVAFSGNVHNAAQILAELEKEGVKPETEAQAELVLLAYKTWGKESVKKLRGSFGMAIWNRADQTLFLARDGFGIKPVYYYQKGAELIFASRLKGFDAHPSFEKELNEAILSAYLCFNTVPTEETFYKNVFRLAPGHTLTFRDGKAETECFFRPVYTEQEQSLEEAAKRINEAIAESTDLQTQGVNFGSFLSGGVDSSYMVSLSKPENTFTVGYENQKYDESVYSVELAQVLGIQNRVCLVNSEEYLSSFKDIVRGMDEPIADPSAAVLYFGAKAASEYVDVVLSGEGSDELFGGYNSYLEEITHQKYMKRPYWVRHLAYLLTCKLPETRKFNFIRRRGQKLENFHIGLDRVFRDDLVRKVLKSGKQIHTRQVTRKYYELYKDSTNLQKRQVIDYYFWLVNDFVHSVTAGAAAFGMQARFPFLDHAVYEAARTLPDAMKISSEGTKLTLRAAAEQVVPTEAYKRKKLGFPVPLKEWMKEDLYYNEIKRAFTGETAKKFFKTKAILKLLDDHRNEVKDCYKKIWTIYTFIIWYDLYF